ncbi:hypothetical protein VTL71DRAFT_9511 [Oculimacula yallundae]|uniref:Uncharacterized protein n=1 Tax=Oculimacula yallundae TaxID=86028 RepID=A0ABR4BS99_9HELO
MAEGPASAESRALGSDATSFGSLDWLSNSSLHKRLKISRNKDNAKKTILWFPNADAETRVVCCLESTNAEKVYLSAFFDRHERKDKYFLDEAVAAANRWKPEYHLSSYQLLEGEKGNPGVDTLFLGGGSTIRRAALGFRFIGDFCDRFWTCHILEYEPKEDYERPRLFQSSDLTNQVNERLRKFKILFLHNSQQGKDAEKSGQILAHQRKVLELLLFDLMLHKINGRYIQMLSKFEIELRQQAQNVWKAKSNLPLKPVDPNHPDILSALHILVFSPMTNNSYSYFSENWPSFQYTLQAMEEDLRETLDKIKLWRNREKDRQLEQPRWTRDDERQFRPAINKAIISNNRKIRELERYLTSIRSLRTLLGSRLESTRNELSFQSAENVRFFTYVTVILLPLGFATAMFSTSGVPSAKPVGYIVVTAFVTLLLTAVGLANAQFLDEKVFRPVANVVHFNKQNQVNPVLQEDNVAGTDNVGGSSTTSSRSTSRKRGHFRWIKYRGQSEKTDGHRAEEGRVRRPK